MKIDGTHYNALWRKKDSPNVIQVIDQRFLPWKLEIQDLRTLDDAVRSIHDMQVRGAPLIGAVGAWGMFFAAMNYSDVYSGDVHCADVEVAKFNECIAHAALVLKQARPTAINLAWAVDRSVSAINAQPTVALKQKAAEDIATAIVSEELDRCRRIGEHGVVLLELLWRSHGCRPLNILTHCNAGWLACIDYGTATAPIYMAHDEGMPLHVWVDETRPWNQGARLTAWELGKHGVPHTIIADNTGGLLMQQGRVDAVIVGTDRTTRCGDVANKIGTYLKALAAHHNNIPFYVALPSSSMDWSIASGADIPIEERDEQEVCCITGVCDESHAMCSIRLAPEDSHALNYGFDITPASLVTGFITENGVCKANEAELQRVFL